jgi:Rrf2 family protein
MLVLGNLADGERIQARRVAEETGVPQAFLHKIVADLVKAGLVRTYSGPGGGLSLARPAVSINMLQILEAIDGPVCLNVCLIRPKECPRDSICPAHGFWGRLQATVVQQLRDATLDTLVAEAYELQRQPRHAEIAYLLPVSASAD